jgi:hypothetical protein
MNKYIARFLLSFLTGVFIGTIILSVSSLSVTEETLTSTKPSETQSFETISLSSGVNKAILDNTNKVAFEDNDDVTVQSNLTDFLIEDTEDVEETEVIKDTEEIIIENTEESIIEVKETTPYKYYKVIDKGYEATLDYDLQEYTYDLCVDYGISEYYTLILCQLYVESGYNANVISSSNDWGIAQINICNHKWLSKELGITNFLDPRQSILCNIYLMSDNLKKYNVESSLICYNAGKPNSTNPSAKRYANKIIALWNNGVVKIK